MNAELTREQIERIRELLIDCAEAVATVELDALCDLALAHLRSQQAGSVLVPREPTEAMWGYLARDIVMWRDMDQPPTGDAMHRHFGRLGREIPAWLAELIPNTKAVPSKGNVAVAIYKAMLAAHETAASPPAGEGTIKDDGGFLP